MTTVRRPGADAGFFDGYDMYSNVSASDLPHEQPWAPYPQKPQILHPNSTASYGFNCQPPRLTDTYREPASERQMGFQGQENQVYHLPIPQPSKQTLQGRRIQSQHIRSQSQPNQYQDNQFTRLLLHQQSQQTQLPPPQRSHETQQSYFPPQPPRIAPQEQQEGPSTTTTSKHPTPSSSPPQPPKRKRVRTSQSLSQSDSTPSTSTTDSTPVSNTSTPVSNTTSTDPSEPNPSRQNHLHRNRVAAHKCRERKKTHIQILESMAETYSAKNLALKRSVAALREEVLALKGEVLRHSGCGCEALDGYLMRSAGCILGSNGSLQRERYGERNERVEYEREEGRRTSGMSGTSGESVDGEYEFE